MPWASPEMPSIQVGALVSFLKQHDIDAEGRNWFVSVANFLTPKIYNSIIQEFLEDGELLYSYLLFPELRYRYLNSSKFLAVLGKILGFGEDIQYQEHQKGIDSFFLKFDQLHEELIESFISQPLLVGFTLNFGQTIASLLMASKIKKRWPACKVIFGGAEATGQLGESLLKNFAFLDYACNGEGELLLLDLYSFLKESATSTTLKTESSIKGLIFRSFSGELVANAPNQMKSLHHLPIPDYEDYFEKVTSLSQYNLKFDTTIAIPLETSRGCPFECSFCSLNIQWDGTRVVSSDNLKESIRYLSQKYECLDFFFVDNLIPYNALALFEEIKNENLDIHFFYEMRADLPLIKLSELRNIGLSRAQVGVEALSNSILKKFRKKTSVIQNIATLKNLEQLGIEVSSNLIIEHPSITQEDIDESVDVMAKLFALPPPTGLAQFALQFGSPDFYSKCNEVLSITGNFKSYELLYPQSLFDNLNLPRKDFHSNAQLPNLTIFRKTVEEWQNRYANFKSVNGRRDLMLKFSDGIDFAIVEDKRTLDSKRIILTRIERDIIVLSAQPISMSELRIRLGGYSSEIFDQAVVELNELDLLYLENDFILSLPMKII